jgi:YD repeat-containing protein
VTRAETPDGFGRMRRVIAADGSTVTINYQARMETGTGGLRIETARAGAPTEIAELDVLGRSVYEEVDGFQQRLVTNIDYAPTGFGKPTQISRAHVRGSEAEVTTVAYDPLGRITSLQLPDSTTMARCYRKNAVCTNDQVGLTSCTVYDEHGRAAHRVEPAATAMSSDCESKSIDISDSFPSEADASSPDRASYVTKRFHYHPSGEVLSILDAADHETRFERDARGNVTTASSPDNGSWVRQYNAFNEIEHEISPASADTVFRYDVLGRLNRRTDIGTGQAGADEVTTFAFDVDQGTGFHGKPVAADTPDGVHTAFGYDAFGRLTTLAKTIPAGGGAQTLTRHTSYDQFGRPDQVSYGAQLPLRIHVVRVPPEHQPPERKRPERF